MVAIKRYADSFQDEEEVVEEPLLKDARFSLTDKILGMQWTMNDLINEDMGKMFAEAQNAFSNSSFFKLGDSFRILVDDSDDARRIFQTFPKENLYKDGLAKIKIQVPVQNRANVISYVTDILHHNGIELVDALISQDGIVLILNESEAPLAYEKLRSEISGK